MMASSSGVTCRICVSGLENVDVDKVRSIIIPLVRLERKATHGLSHQQRGRTRTASCGAAFTNSEAGSFSLYTERFRRTQPSCGNGKLESIRKKRPNATAKQFASVPRSGCLRCGDEGAVECLTCQGSGLYVDSILESQGIIVKVKCIGCGGNGHTLCPDCGGKVTMESWNGRNGPQSN